MYTEVGLVNSVEKISKFMNKLLDALKVLRYFLRSSVSFSVINT